VTILDNDAEPFLSVDDPSVSESGNVFMTYAVSLSEPSAKTISVDYQTAESKKNADWDYTSGTLTFAPGETQHQVDVVVHDDGLPEADEPLELILSSPVNATFGKDIGTGTIVDDDFPLLSVDDVTVSEDPSGQTAVTFTVSLSERSERWINVEAMAVDGTAIAGKDYRFFRTTLTFAPGEITQQVHGVVFDEDVETFELVLDDPSGATIGDGSGVGTILDDDPSPVVSRSNVALQEGDAGVKGFQFTISLDAASERTVKVNYATVDDAATSPADFTSTSGTLHFAAGERTKTVTVNVVGDTDKEPNEPFYLAFTFVKNAIEGSGGEGRILNDD
jgi:hypothetical protein